MALRNWTRFKEYEGGEKPLTNYDVNPPERVFFNTETGYYITVVKAEDGTYDVKVGWQDSGIEPPFADDPETAPLPPNVMDAYNNWDSKDEAISEAFEMRKNRKAKIPREDRYGHEDRPTLYDIAEEEMVDREFFATFWEIRFPRNTDRHYAGEWAERLMYGEDQLQGVADSQSMEAYRQAEQETS